MNKDQWKDTLSQAVEAEKVRANPEFVILDEIHAELVDFARGATRP